MEQVAWGDSGEGIVLWEVGGFFNCRSDVESQAPRHTNKNQLIKDKVLTHNWEQRQWRRNERYTN